jgi:hypothetical protein
MGSSSELSGEGRDDEWPEGAHDETVRLSAFTERKGNEASDDRIRERDDEISGTERGERLA